MKFDVSNRPKLENMNLNKILKQALKYNSKQTKIFIQTIQNIYKIIYTIYTYSNVKKVRKQLFCLRKRENKILRRITEVVALT